MSYSTITQASRDSALIDRVQAACQQEARDGSGVGTPFGGEVIADPGRSIELMWPVAIDNEAAYESAVIAENPNPGGDESVITDGAILAGVQTHWPA
jgi:hypothetical protein